MFTVEHPIGRLVEVRTASPISFGEIARADSLMREYATSVGGRLVICADYTRLTFLPGDLAEHWVGMFRRHNESIDVSAIIVAPTSAVAILQMTQVITESKNPKRKVFQQAAEALKWLRPHLEAAEHAHLIGFLGTESGTLRPIPSSSA